MAHQACAHGSVVLASARYYSGIGFWGKENKVSNEASEPLQESSASCVGNWNSSVRRGNCSRWRSIISKSGQYGRVYGEDGLVALALYVVMSIVEVLLQPLQYSLFR